MQCPDSVEIPYPETLQGGHAEQCLHRVNIQVQLTPDYTMRMYRHELNSTSVVIDSAISAAPRTTKM